MWQPRQHQVVAMSVTHGSHIMDTWQSCQRHTITWQPSQRCVAATYVPHLFHIIAMSSANSNTNSSAHSQVNGIH
ncbi:hypothetical protein TorRG33x02_169380, partial [Trema orientale]